MTTVLAAGDIAFTGFNSDNPDEFTFVALTDIEAGTEIRFTDSGWLAAGGFRSTEGVFIWTAPANIAAGTVINPAFAGPSFSASGDQIHAYQGNETAPSFVASVHFNGTGYEADATSSNTSALPAGLTVGTSAVAIPETDNGVYNGPLTGNKAELQAAINNAANWVTDNSRIDDIEPASFTVTDATPSPSVIVNDLDLATDEGGMADTYEVTLSVAPTQPVTITIAVGADLDVAPAELVFDATNFDQPQQVAVTAVDDDLPEAAEIAEIQHSVTSDDPAYDGILAPIVEVSVSASDIEIVAIYEIQGAGHVSDFVLAGGQTVAEFYETLPAGTSNVFGDLVSTSGIVTAVDSNGMVYTGRNTHFYGQGKPDPLREDITLLSLEAKSARLMTIAAQQHCACVNLSEELESRLLFPRVSHTALSGDLPLTNYSAELSRKALSLENEAGYLIQDGKYWEHYASINQDVLAEIDRLWLSAVGV
ncbi:hypothetical protein K3740_03080 [Ruegeria conchae]|uniref:hypothetical protein n=1 Tax=Ruegeria conchae TaxID=981384 RepID=UPI0021A94895|nr:hypothetical protein [Ruegeria conchae]UWR03701.1 hypothetical protein K3740_03080 [Ruegeria conchae]